MPTKNEILASLKAEVTAARAIQAKADAEGRDFTPAEADTLQRHVKTAEHLKGQLDTATRDEGIKAAIANLGADPAPTSRVKALNARRSPWVQDTLERIQKSAVAAGGVKAAFSGSIDVAQPIATGVVAQPQTPLRILDLITDRKVMSEGNTFNYLRQTVRTNNADVVADNALKPTSIYTIAEVEDRVRVIAHLSEVFPKRYLDDYAELGQLLESEMEYGLYLALEDQVVAGDGTGENMTGLLNVSGTLAQAFATDLLTTTRKAVTQMAGIGETPTAWAVNPNDAELIDLLSDGMERFYYDGPQQQLTTAPMWSLPVVQSLAVPAGTAVLANWDYVTLVVREDPELTADQSGDLFSKNQVRLRLEGRYGVALRRASALCKVDLTA